MKFKVGDKVRIVSRSVIWNSLMFDTLGKVGIVIGITVRGNFCVKTNLGSWNYKPEDLEHYNKGLDPAGILRRALSIPEE